MINFTLCTEQNNTALSFCLLNGSLCGQLGAGSSSLEMAELEVEWVVSPTLEFTWCFLRLNCFYFAEFSPTLLLWAAVLCVRCLPGPSYRGNFSQAAQQETMSIIFSSYSLNTVNNPSNAASAWCFVCFLLSRVSLHAFVPDPCSCGCISTGVFPWH